MMPKLSVTIVTYNEGQNIRRTLESVKWVDEIVVVDSGSTDDTVPICEGYGVRVIQAGRIGVAKVKNLAIEKATGEWILSLDADEPIESALADEIRAIIVSPTSLDGYRIPRRTYFLGKLIKHGGWYPDYNLRLFRKEKGRFVERAVHESVKVQGSVGVTKHAIDHYAYPDIALFMAKMHSYSSLAVNVMQEKGVTSYQASSFNIVGRPVFTFIYKYFFRLGFLDGKHGLIINVLHSYYVFAKYAKAWEYKIRVEGQGSRGQGTESK
jgi:glycosyltransferase involved in cell wall biosynthesis